MDIDATNSPEARKFLMVWPVQYDAWGRLNFRPDCGNAMPGCIAPSAACYVIGVVVAATISLPITMLHNELPLQTAVFTQASLWLLTTAVAALVAPGEGPSIIILKWWRTASPPR